MIKICLKCKQEKLLNDFYKRTLSSDGHCGECKICTKKRNKKNHRKYYLFNKEQILQKNKEYLKIYKEKYKPRRNELKLERYRNDVCFKLADRLRTRIRSAIKRNQKSGSAVRDLGCSVIEFKQYIESKFQENMSWDNYGTWHLDHIIPLSFFTLAIREEFLKAAHYTNYQPLWAHENLTKSNKLI